MKYNFKKLQLQIPFSKSCRLSLDWLHVLQKLLPDFFFFLCKHAVIFTYF